MQWKVLVVDETSRKLIDNAVSEDDILNLNVTSKPNILIDNRIASANDLSCKMSSRSRKSGNPTLWMRCISYLPSHILSIA